jgi:hypothetical protein
MQTRQLLLTGVMAVAAFGALTFMPAAADPTPNAIETFAIASVNPPETPQDRVWDMTYGQLTPPAAVVEEESAVEATDNPQDLSIG